MSRISKINTEIFFYKNLVEKLSENLFLEDDAAILAIYEELNTNRSCIRNKSILNFRKQLIPSEGQVSTLGVDLPSWFGDLENCKKKVMIIGIDPMRSKKDFNREGANINQEVIIGTPYSFHLESMWNNNGRYKYYSQFISSLIRENFVYLTDIHKTFFYFNLVRSYKYYNQKNRGNSSDQPSSKIFIKMLEDEIVLLKPDIIITLGDISYHHLINTCDNIRRNEVNKFGALSSKYYFDQERKCKVPIYPLMHLAAWKQNLLEFRDKHLNEMKSEDFGIVFFEILKKYNAI